MATTPQAFNISFNGYTNFTASRPPSQRVAALNTSNPTYLRYAVLTGDSVQIVFGTSSVTIPLISIYQAAFSASAVLLAPPLIQTNPSNVTVTHPASFSLYVSASSEVTPTYQWYWQSSSLATYTPCPTTYFSGTASMALTCSTTAINVENSGSYFCLVSNSAGAVSSSYVTSYIL